MAITWRDVQAQNQRDALLGQGQALRSINSGLSGIQGLLTNAAASKEEDALNSVLNRINQLNTVEGVNQARAGSGLDLSGLNPEAQIRARSALDSRLNSLYQSDQAANQFQQRQLQQQEQPILNQIGKLEAQGNYGEAIKLANQLSNPGETLRRLTTGQKSANTKSSLDAAREELYFNLGGINRSREGNKEVSNTLLKQFPYLSDGLEIGKDGQLKLKSGLTDDQKAQYETALQEVGQQYSSASSYGDLSQDVLQRAFSDPNLNVNDVQSLLSTVSSAQQLDPVVREQVQQKAINQRLAENVLRGEQDVLGVRQQAFNEANPVDPTLSRRAAGSNQDVINSFQELADSNDSYTDFGKGDFKAFNNSVNSVIRDLGKENFKFSPEALQLALNEMPEVIEAKQEGNLGDFLDNIDESILKIKIREKQRLIDQDADIRQTRLQNQINTIRGKNALEQDLIRRLGQ